MRESAIRATFQYFRQIDLAIVGIGSLIPPTRSMLVDSGYLTAAELRALQRGGAVGDVYSYFIAADGSIVRTGLYDRLITIGLPDIRRIRTSVGIATGPAKASAAVAAVRGSFVNTLIVDAELARAMLAIHAKDAA